MSAPVLRTDGVPDRASRPRAAAAARALDHPLSPINRRRLALFRQHRRGFWCLWIFLVIFGLSLFAEIHRQRPAAHRLLQGRDPVSRLRRLPGREVRRLHRAYRIPGQGDRRRDRGARLDAVAADPLLLRHHQLRPAHARPLAADLGAHPGAMRGGGGRAHQAGRHRTAACHALEYDWLGTDDAGRDVLARIDLRRAGVDPLRPGADAALLG